MVPVRDNGDLGRMAGVEVTRSGQREERETLEMGLVGLIDGFDVRLQVFYFLSVMRLMTDGAV